MAKHDKKLAEVLHFNLYGKRDDKYNFLNQNSIGSIPWEQLEPNEPNYFFTVKNFADRDVYESGFKIDELFRINNVGIVTARDSFTLYNSKELLSNAIIEFIALDDETARKRFNLGPDARDWKVSLAKADLMVHFPNKGSFIKINYRPFDSKWTFLTGKSKGFHSYPRIDVMQHLLKLNISLIAPKQAINGFNHIFLSNSPCDKNFIDSAGQFGAGNVFPLYLYSVCNAQKTINTKSERTPNLKPEIVNQIAEKLGLTFTNEKEPTPNTFAPIDILDYIYAVLHSPTYREKYKEFLKIDFPRVPYPANQETFWQLVKLGGELRQIHLLESPIVEKYITQYPIDGDNMVERVVFDLTPALSKGEGAKTINAGNKEFTEPNMRGTGDKPGYVTANASTYKIIKEFREDLKNKPTEAEGVIWEYLRNKKTGHKIRRQHIVGDFVTDFICLSKKLIIEIDGKIHDFKKEYDTIRTQILNQKGYQVIRFTNDEVLRSPHVVAQKIKECLDSRADYSIEEGLVAEKQSSSYSSPLEESEQSYSPPLEGQGEVGRVYINPTQYFNNVPEVAWEFYIGGYQPAQKWLKDRKGRKLEFEDILHYQKIILALTETDRLMKEIDKIEF